MLTESQAFVIAGLIIQFVGVLYSVKETYHPYTSKKLIGNEGNTFTNQIGKVMKTWLLTIILFFIGFLLQGIGVCLI